MSDAPLAREIRAFEARKPELEKHHFGKFVVFHGETLEGAWDTFEAAAEYAVGKYGRGPYLIRQVGSPALAPPVSLMYRHSVPASV